MTRLAYDPDEGGELAEAPGGDGGLAGYDQWKGASPPEYAELPQEPRQPPTWLDLLPAGSCGRRNWTLCTLPAGHHNDNGTLCNSLQWGGLR